MARSASPATRKSWKQTAATRHKGSNASKRNTRWGFTLLGVVLVIAFAFLLWRPTKPRTYFVQLPILNYDRLVPAIEYVEGDYAPLVPLPEAGGAILHAKNLDILSTSETVGKFPELFAEEALRPKDVLILFVSAHGFSQEGEPYIACSDFSRNSSVTASGIYPMADFLDQVEQCEASTKLVILDTGRLQYDPRVGLVVNEFPLLLAEDMERRGDPTLFVMTGVGMMKYPNVLHGQGRTLFASSVVDGLTGAADSLEGNEIQEPDDKVSLAELYMYVVDRMADYFPPESSMAQHPYLMQGGKGVFTDFSAIEEADTFLISLDDIRDAERAEQAAREAEEAERKAAEEAESARSIRHGAEPNAVARRLGASFGGSLAYHQPATETPPDSPAAPEQPATTTPPATAESSPTTPPATGNGSPTTPTPAATPQPASPATPPNNEAADSEDDDVRHAKLRDAIHNAWSQRDQLESRTIGAGWSPIDFAPHYWRSLTERLVDYERRYLAGGDYDLDALTKEVEAEASGLTQLARDIARDKPPRPVTGAPLVSQSLLAAWRDFVNDGVLKENYDAAIDSAAAMKRARQLYHDQMHRALYYVRWHEYNSFAMADGAPGVQEVANYLEELGYLQLALQGERTPGELESRVARVETVRGQLDDIIGQELNAALDSAETPIGQRKLYDLLATPLLDSVDRRRALRELERNGREPLNRTNHDAHKSIPRLEISSSQWRALANRLNHRALLCKLGDPVFYPIVNDALLAISDPTPTGPEATQKLLGIYRQIGLRLAEYYRDGLPKQIEKGNVSGVAGGADTLAAQRALRMLDARDVDRIGRQKFPAFPLLPEAIGSSNEPFVALETDAKQLTLSIDSTSPQRINLAIKHRGESGAFATVMLRFDPTAIAVRNPVNDAELSPDERFRVPLLKGSRINQGELALDVWAKKDTSEAELESPLSIGVAVAQLPIQMEIVECLLPNPDFIELRVQRVGAPAPHNDNDGKITMRPFPNRESSYRMWLRNESGVEKEVTAQLLAVPRPENPAWAPGKLFSQNGNNYQLFPGVRRTVFLPSSTNYQVDSLVRELAKTKPFTLSADANEEITIPFLPPGSDLPEGAAPPPPAAGEPANPDISYGLVMLIRETPPNESSVWDKWIAIEPQSPIDYMKARVNYDATLKQIQVSVKPDPEDTSPTGRPDGVLDKIPPRLSKKPIKVEWDLARSGLAGMSGSTIGEYKGPDPERAVELYVNGVENDGQKREIWLTVDGYPRAMAYTVVCEQRQTGPAEWDDPDRDLRQNAERLELKWIAMPNETVPADYKEKKLDRMFFYTEGGRPRLELEQMAKGLEKQAEFLEYGQPAWFPEEKRTAPVAFQYIDARIEVDAPGTAFGSIENDKDEIVIGFEGRNPERFYSDRDMKMELTSITEDGQLRLLTTVTDYTVRVKTQGISHQRKNFIARLIRNNQVTAGLKAHPIIFDNQRPNLDNFGITNNINKPIPVGEEIEAFVEATADSGIERVEFAIDLTGDEEWEMLEPAVDRTDGLFRADNKYRQRLSTEDLKEGRRYKLLVRAFDRIGYYPSETLVLSFTTARPPAPGNNPANEVYGVVKGVVSKGTFNDFTPGQIKIVLEGGGEPTKRATNRSNGTFEFKNVKVGPQYKLSAEGKFQQRPIYGELEGVEATAPDKTPKRYNIVMDRDERPANPLPPR